MAATPRGSSNRRNGGSPGRLRSSSGLATLLLSREQYLYDVEQLGYMDCRLTRASAMTAGDVAVWAGAIPERQCGKGAPDAPERKAGH